MPTSKISQWLSFMKLIITKGSVWIKPFHYQNNIQGLWNDNSEAKKLGIKHKTQKRNFKHILLFLPFVGPLIALISQYRLQNRWPTYVYHWPEKKLAYIRISKNACTSVQAAILQKQHPDLDISLLSVNQINEMGKMYIKPFLESGYECFTLVRSPYDRLLSCYFDQVIGRDERFYFDDYIFSVLKKGMSFEDFVKNIALIPNVVKDIHFRPQYEYIRGIENVKCFKIGEDEQILNKYLEKYDLQLSSYNKNKIKFNENDYYTTEIKKIVADIYQDDFLYFGYSIT